MKRKLNVCKCGHLRSEHRGSSGPNSIGRSHFGECVNGSRVSGPYRFGGCQCWEFKVDVWKSIRKVFS